MPLLSSLVGRCSEPAETDVDARWLMAYAAGLGERGSHYLDTLRPGGVIGHPLFSVCVEWATGQAISPPGPTGLTPGEARMGVHYAHDVVLHRPLRAGARVTTTSEVVAVTPHRAGALMVTRIDAVAEDEPQWTTWMSSLMRDVAVDGEPASTQVAPPRPPAPPTDAPSVASSVVEVAATAAHVYTECARIWNPIHTDTAVARAAGLPGIILHGTATLALAVSHVLGLAGGVGPERVRRVCGQFGAMVLMPSELVVRVLGGDINDEGAIHFDVRTEAGQPAVRSGLVLLDTPQDPPTVTGTT